MSVNLDCDYDGIWDLCDQLHSLIEREKHPICMYNLKNKNTRYIKLSKESSHQESGYIGKLEKEIASFASRQSRFERAFNLSGYAACTG